LAGGDRGDRAFEVPRPTATQACKDVQRAIKGKGARNPIIAAGHAGSRIQPARGLSIYFLPIRDASAFCRELDFARRTRWAEFLNAYLGKGE
jgi:hypothetical protein